VITLEAQPAHRPRQHYRIFDAARGMLEEGYVLVEDMIARQPWLDESGTIPVEVLGTPRPASLIPTGLTAPSAR
jgi:hypothetical protein